MMTRRKFQKPGQGREGQGLSALGSKEDCGWGFKARDCHHCHPTPHSLVALLLEEGRDFKVAWASPDTLQVIWIGPQIHWLLCHTKSYPVTSETSWGVLPESQTALWSSTWDPSWCQLSTKTLPSHCHCPPSVGTWPCPKCSLRHSQSDAPAGAKVSQFRCSFPHSKAALCGNPLSHSAPSWVSWALKGMPVLPQTTILVKTGAWLGPVGLSKRLKWGPGAPWEDSDLKHTTCCSPVPPSPSLPSCTTSSLSKSALPTWINFLRQTQAGHLPP